MSVIAWKVEVIAIHPRVNKDKNPISGDQIDPTGALSSVVSMRLTHKASGLVIRRTDVFSMPTRDELKRYARNIINGADVNRAAQMTDELIGELDLLSEPALP